MIPDIKSLAAASAVGTVLLLVGLGLLGVLLVQEWPDYTTAMTTTTTTTTPAAGFPWFNTAAVSQYPLAACALLYSYEEYA